jgi:hypothetical protein
LCYEDKNRHDIAEILSKVALNSIKQTNKQTTKIQYIMYNVQDYSVFYNDYLRPVVIEGWHYTHMWRALA